VRSSRKKSFPFILSLIQLLMIAAIAIVGKREKDLLALIVMG